MKYLGVDWGKVHIGLSLSEGEIATPFKEIKVDGLEDALRQITAVIEEEGIGQVVVGVPDSGEAKQMAQKGVEGLRMLGLGVEEVDETLTSHNSGGDHMKAAALILQEYLESL